MNFDKYFAIGNGLVELMDPLVEVVIHCVRTDKIIFINGSLSNREIGDPSLLGSDLSSIEEGVYAKLNFDGRLLRSISIPLKENDIMVGLMCINYDITMFQELHNLTNVFLGKSLTVRSDALFKNDWQDKIHQIIHQILQEKKLSFNELTNLNKKELVHQLYELGAFSEKNAADYIAKILSVSRATIFNYLRVCRKGNNAS